MSKVTGKIRQVITIAKLFTTDLFLVNFCKDMQTEFRLLLVISKCAWVPFTKGSVNPRNLSNLNVSVNTIEVYSGGGEFF